MAVGIADVAKGINSCWEASTLNATFKALWAAASTEFPVLNDQEALGATPFPYCVMDSFTSVREVRMSSTSENSVRDVKNVEVVFNIHAKAVSGDSRTAKEIAADLAAEVMKVFGGHPTVSPTGTVTLDNGNFLITTYQNDALIRTGDDEYLCRLVYNVKFDVPVAV